ncbi:MAG: MBL fold metallo-hydrolase [Lentisphaeria bacterium]|nr:MBL fold metallo-hydrolase [Lentisphaeria bacterium]
MFTLTNVGAISGSDAFLLVTAGKTALLDSGFSFCAEQMLDNIARVLGERRLDYVLLTHSHYDHASGSVYCRKRWPEVQIAGSAHTARVLAKDSARTLMRQLNDSAAREQGVTHYEDLLAELRVDRIVSEGDEIDLGSMQLKVLELPGHTRCSIGFYAEKAKLLLGCETLGVLSDSRLIMPCCLVNYEDSLRAIERVAKLDIESLLLPHTGLLQGPACRQFLADARHWLEETRRRIREANAAGKSEADLIQMFKDLFYTELVRKNQPEKAFDLNASYIIPLLLKES